MNSTTATPKKTKNITAFFILTFIISLPPYIVAALVPQEMVMLTGLIIALAPITAALILAYRENRADGAKRLLKRSFDYKNHEKNLVRTYPFPNACRIHLGIRDSDFNERTAP